MASSSVAPRTVVSISPISTSAWPKPISSTPRSPLRCSATNSVDSSRSPRSAVGGLGRPAAAPPAAGCCGPGRRRRRPGRRRAARRGRERAAPARSPTTASFHTSVQLRGFSRSDQDRLVSVLVTSTSPCGLPATIRRTLARGDRPLATLNWTKCSPGSVDDRNRAARPRGMGIGTVRSAFGVGAEPVGCPVREVDARSVGSPTRTPRGTGVDRPDPVGSWRHACARTESPGSITPRSSAIRRPYRDCPSVGGPAGRAPRPASRAATAVGARA